MSDSMESRYVHRWTNADCEALRTVCIAAGLDAFYRLTQDPESWRGVGKALAVLLKNPAMEQISPAAIRYKATRLGIVARYGSPLSPKERGHVRDWLRSIGWKQGMRLPGSMLKIYHERLWTDQLPVSELPPYGQPFRNRRSLTELRGLVRSVQDDLAAVDSMLGNGDVEPEAEHESEPERPVTQQEVKEEIVKSTDDPLKVEIVESPVIRHTRAIPEDEVNRGPRTSAHFEGYYVDPISFHLDCIVSVATQGDGRDLCTMQSGKRVMVVDHPFERHRDFHAYVARLNGR